MNIDWSKAPKDATHAISFEGVDHRFRKMVGGKWLGWLTESEKWYGVGGLLSEQYIERPKKQEAWDGVGLPPVGAKCEVDHGGRVFWDIVTIIAHHGEKAIYEDPHGHHKYLWGLTGNFRPIKTAEQVAAEEREAAITDIALIFGKDPARIAIREKAGVLYDAGYRKQ